MEEALKQLSDLIVSNRRKFANAVFSTTRFLSKVKETVKKDKDGHTIESTMASYAYNQDSGVYGTDNQIAANPNSANPPGKFSGRFKMIGGNLPFSARVSIYKKGLKPKPFVNKSVLSAVEQQGLNLIADAAAQETADQIVETFNRK